MEVGTTTAIKEVTMFAVLYVADFWLQAVLRIEGDAAGRLVALLDDTRKPPVVIACTAAAAAAGVEIGQTSPQAMARCAGVELRVRQPAAEADARAGLLAAAFSVSPQVEDTSPGVCTINVDGLAAKEREPALRAAVEQLEKLGLRATAGLAATPLLAGYAAKFGGAPAFNRQEEKGRLEAGAAVCMATGNAREFLRGLPLAVAEPSVEMAGVLAGWGVKTLGDLTALRKADVAQRLGPEGLALWERAAGEVRRPLKPVSVPKTFTAELVFEYEIETLEPLLFVLRRFIDRLALELRNAGFVAGEMVLGLLLEEEEGQSAGELAGGGMKENGEAEERGKGAANGEASGCYVRAFRLPEPTAREELLFRVLHTHLETLRTASAVRGVRLECRPVRPLARQQDLFESALRDPHGFAETLARVAAVVGPDHVGTPVVENSHRPDAVKLETPAAVVPPMIETEPQSGGRRVSGETEARGAEWAESESRSKLAACEAGVQRGLALRRYRMPLAATVELVGIAPGYVWTEVIAGSVKELAGPWRGSGEWWDADRRWAREEWDVELEGGGLYRLMRTPKGWFVEGEYD